MIRTRTTTLAAAVCAAFALAVSTALAQPNPNNQSGGAAGVVAAVVQIQDTLNNLQVLSGNESVEIITVKDSLNNVLQNAQVLNNITILQDFLNDNTCLAVCQSLNNVLLLPAIS
jgi:hypothetical protein